MTSLVMIAPVVAFAATVDRFVGDSTFATYCPNLSACEIVTPVARSGDGTLATSSTGWELGIQTPATSNFGTLDSEQIAQNPGTPDPDDAAFNIFERPFEVSYDVDVNRISMTLGSWTVEATQSFSAVQSLFLRSRSGDSSGRTTALYDIVFASSAGTFLLGDQTPAVGGDGTRAYLVLASTNLDTDWTISGTLRHRWRGSAYPSDNSGWEMAHEFMFTNIAYSGGTEAPEIVPLPPAALLFAPGLAALAALRLRRG